MAEADEECSGNARLVAAIAPLKVLDWKSNFALECSFSAGEESGLAPRAAKLPLTKRSVNLWKTSEVS